MLGCMPSYWIPVEGNAKNMELCNEANLTKIDGLYETLNNDTELKWDLRYGKIKETRGSCNRMSVISLKDEVLEKKATEDLNIIIRYVSQSYQEVGYY